MRSLKGDLLQMYTQIKFLEKQGIRAKVSGGTPLIEESDYTDALKQVYSMHIDGWWNYKDDLIGNGVCTEEEFEKSLDIPFHYIKRY